MAINASGDGTDQWDGSLTLAVGAPGANSGQGAVYHWAGNDKVGEGEMTITKSSPPSEIDIKLEFMKPWKAIGRAIRVNDAPTQRQCCVDPKQTAARCPLWIHQFQTKPRIAECR